MTALSIARRRWLAGAAALALQGPLARLAFAAPTRGGADDGRLVVVLLRGALDGLAAVPPVGDPSFAALRPSAPADAARDGAPLPLDGRFALHPALGTLHGWYGEGQLLVAHAVASPYRERSHFDAQQLLESGGNRPFELQTGWLGRALQIQSASGVALTSGLPLALRGAAAASSWAPSRTPPSADEELLARVAQLYAHDAPLAAAFAQAQAQRNGGMVETSGDGGFVALAGQAGRFLSAPDGPAVAWLDSNGWDTHTLQAPRLARLLGTLDRGLGALRVALGERWATTTLLVMTEFGRSAALNGSGGTDHGTAGVAFAAGGRVAGGRVLADWPGLAAGQLYQGRDLRPTLDLRAFIAPALQRQLGLGSAQIARDVLPGAPAGVADFWKA